MACKIDCLKAIDPTIGKFRPVDQIEKRRILLGMCLQNIHSESSLHADQAVYHTELCLLRTYIPHTELKSALLC